jgi:hypothetical protein
VFPASSGAQPPPCTSTVCGTTADTGQWIADFPSPISKWNGTLLLYSHGFGPPLAADAPDPNTQAALLADGYALAGSSYDPNGSWWALDSALSDQLQTLSAVEALLPYKPVHVFAFGTSMGGLISALEDERFPRGALQASLTTCGIVAGAVNLNNYQLDGEYAMDQLLAGGAIKLVNFSGPGEALATGKQFDVVAQQAQTSAAGRARLALAMSLMNVATWASGQTMPKPGDYVADEDQQYLVQFSYTPPLTAGAIQTTQDFVESVPGLDMHTIADQLVPVQQENYYRDTVAFAGRSDLLRQAFVQRQLHCNFTPSELVAGVEAVQQRVQTGRWGNLADPAVLNAAANATGLSSSIGTPAFIPYEPARLSGQNGPFDPFDDGSYPYPFGLSW